MTAPSSAVAVASVGRRDCGHDYGHVAVADVRANAYQHLAQRQVIVQI